MNSATVENMSDSTLMQVADRLARVLIHGARAGRSRKELLATLTARIRLIRGHCLVCATEWPLTLLGQDQARHLCVVARRASFVSLRRRLEKHFRTVLLRCPACAARDAEGVSSNSDGVAEGGEHDRADSGLGQTAD
ncbi:MAG: hypothetical protein JXQ75_11530 [Phycisphaerae bacterium]|nr:hypothetical protein [Phycisphaerae bacterium]